MTKLTALNGNLVIRQEEHHVDNQNKGMIIQTTNVEKVKCRAIVIDGGDDTSFENDANAVLDGCSIIFDTAKILATVGEFLIIPKEAVLARVDS